jgi:hypothetical protein
MGSADMKLATAQGAVPELDFISRIASDLAAVNPIQQTIGEVATDYITRDGATADFAVSGADN